MRYDGTINTAYSVTERKFCHTVGVGVSEDSLFFSFSLITVNHFQQHFTWIHVVNEFYSVLDVENDFQPNPVQIR